MIKINNKKANSHFDLINNTYKTFVKSKRSQHEIVGFILIVIIVVIIGLFLLVFYLRQKPIRHESLNVQNFLQASMIYTTDCYIGIEPLNLEELIKSCYRNDRCSNEEMACDVLDNTLSELVHESWLVSPDKPVKAYFLNIHYEEKSEEDEEAGKFGKEEILSLKEGNCTGSKTGAEHFLHYGKGNIIITMELCYV